MNTPIIKELFQQCIKAFRTEASIRGGEETRKALRSVIPILENVTAADVGIFDDTHGCNYDCALSQHLTSRPQFSMDIFIIPAAYCMPLHDHPRMTVCTKMLYGSAHFMAYDWENSPDSNGEGVVKLSLDETLTKEDSVKVLYPDKANIHAIKANTTCAFLDILIPPYDSLERTCTYYKPKDADDTYNPNFLQIEEKLNIVPYNPNHFACITDIYRGPKLY